MAEVAAMVVEALALAFPLIIGSAIVAYIALILGVVVIEADGVDVVVGVMLSLELVFLLLVLMVCCCC